MSQNMSNSVHAPEEHPDGRAAAQSTPRREQLESRTVREDPDSSSPLNAIKQVSKIRLRGSPEVLVLDASAFEGSDEASAGLIITKLALLARRDGLRVLVRGAGERQRNALERAVPREQLVLTAESGPADLSRVLREQGVTAERCLAILAVPGGVVPRGCTAFYVGSGAPPERAHVTRRQGAEPTDLILALYGTALAQERAGVAFRSVSQHHDIPAEAPFPREIVDGVIRSAERPEPAHPSSTRLLPSTEELRELAARAYARLVRNVLPDGVVVGAPSHGEHPGEPNYWFYWQRDGSVVMGHLIDWYQRPPLGLDTTALTVPIERYLRFVAKIQRAGHLGTSRYTVEGEPILGFGNPQLDGPALSALALTRLSEAARGWPQLKRYLGFLLTADGHGHTMDAWEFIYGRLFNAELLRQRALLSGAEVAARLGHTGEAARHRAEADRSRHDLGDFVDERLGRLVASRETFDPWFAAISGLDMAIIAAYVGPAPSHGRLPTGARVDGPKLGRDLDNLAHPAVLATMMALEESYASFYRVNRDWAAGGNAGWGLGRFPEDANDGVGSSGGNPWPLATLWAAQFYYRLVQEIAALLESGEPSFGVEDARQVAFFERASGAVIEQGKSIEAHRWRERVFPALMARGDAYLNFVIHHIPEDGSITEQIDRETGAPRGAPDLSWALSELIATIALRESAHLDV